MDSRKSPPPSARKASLAEQAADPWLGASRMVFDRLRGLVPGSLVPGSGMWQSTDGGSDALPVLPIDLDHLRQPTDADDPGMAPPVSEEGEPLAVDRAFAFVDICGFTSYCDRNGEAAAVEVLGRFRSVTRHVVGQRGVRVSKWLGDGVMLVGTDVGPLVAACVELVSRFRATGLDTHVGIAAGDVLLFEGDDYVGRTVNLAARLSEAAGPGEILAADPISELPPWIEHRGTIAVHVAGMGRVDGVHRLGSHPEVDAMLGGTTSAA
jgi:class 3 adenylate cyclase